MTIAGTSPSNRRPNTPTPVASIVFIQVGIIAQGLLQYLPAVLFHTAVCNASGSWLPHPSRPLSDLIVANGLRQSLSEFLPDPPPGADSLEKLILEQQHR